MVSIIDYYLAGDELILSRPFLNWWLNPQLETADKLGIQFGI